MSQAKTPEQLQLLGAIETLLAEGENQISLPLTAINQSIAALSVQSSKSVVSIQNRLIRSIEQHAVAQDNEIDAFGLAILKPLQDWQEENNLLLNHLAAAAGVIQPGDPLEAALVTQVAEQPELAYSATLLIALRDVLPLFGQIVEVLREIRDRLPNAPVHVPGEPRASAVAIEDQLSVKPPETLPTPSGAW